MIRQENTVPIFTYENEGEEVMYTERGQRGRRNPYLVDYEAQRSQQGGEGRDAVYGDSMSRRLKQDNVGRKRPVESDSFVRTSRFADFREENNANQRKDVDVLIYRSRSAERDGGRRKPEGVHRPTSSASARAPRRPAASAPSGSPRRPAAPAPSGSPRRPVASAPSGSPRRPAASAPSGSPRRPVASAPSRPSRRPVASASSGSSRRLVAPVPTGPSRRPGTSAASGATRRTASAEHPVSARRKKHALLQRIAVVLWAVGIFVLAVSIMFKNGGISSAKDNPEDTLPVANMDDDKPETSGLLVQGLPAEDFARHPDWTENLLTPNEYSRPGEALESVTNIFVHYTANPRTSAAQNRSYFEQQKDTHERSVSAHFIIGYEGEIIQCVPLDEIAYAVATRNYDSISIECCFLEKDGSFTQETYDSLISLLAWLIDVYDLDSNDILRHYDCGGKKCPLYYTEHPGEWEQLKKDVDKL